ncbi:MAG: hypothetical protein BZ134_01995 [Methanosphaera sp. SHI1033]|nr:MAG: hypothetical protein BZ134_01995 [Methanosphaera sp. SHI1033]
MFDKINKEIKNFIKYSINEDKKEKKMMKRSTYLNADVKYDTYLSTLKFIIVFFSLFLIYL